MDRGERRQIDIRLRPQRPSSQEVTHPQLPHVYNGNPILRFSLFAQPVEVTLDPPDATGAEAGRPGLDKDYLILSTIHSAKGQEWEDP
jgi:hypothetical protein